MISTKPFVNQWRSLFRRLPLVLLLLFLSHKETLAKPQNLCADTALLVDKERLASLGYFETRSLLFPIPSNHGLKFSSKLVAESRSVASRAFIVNQYNDIEFLKEFRSLLAENLAGLTHPTMGPKSNRNVSQNDLLNMRFHPFYVIEQLFFIQGLQEMNILGTNNIRRYLNSITEADIEASLKEAEKNIRSKHLKSLLREGLEMTKKRLANKFNVLKSESKPFSPSFRLKFLRLIRHFFWIPIDEVVRRVTKTVTKNWESRTKTEHYPDYKKMEKVGLGDWSNIGEAIKQIKRNVSGLYGLDSVKGPLTIEDAREAQRKFFNDLKGLDILLWDNSRKLGLSFFTAKLLGISNLERGRNIGSYLQMYRGFGTSTHNFPKLATQFEAFDKDGYRDGYNIPREALKKRFTDMVDEVEQNLYHGMYIVFTFSRGSIGSPYVKAMTLARIGFLVSSAIIYFSYF